MDMICKQYKGETYQKIVVFAIVEDGELSSPKYQLSPFCFDGYPV